MTFSSETLLGSSSLRLLVGHLKWNMPCPALKCLSPLVPCDFPRENPDSGKLEASESHLRPLYVLGRLFFTRFAACGLQLLLQLQLAAFSSSPLLLTSSSLPLRRLDNHKRAFSKRPLTARLLSFFPAAMWLLRADSHLANRTPFPLKQGTESTLGADSC